MYALHSTLTLLLQVYKTGVTHYFSIEAAKRDFGYRPLPRDLTNVVKWFVTRGHYRDTQHIANKQILLLSALAVLATLYILAPLFF